MRSQSTTGAIDERLGDDGFLELAREICAYHHEKWDGSGYPYGMRGSQIPVSARLVALADVYDALRSKRPYKEPMSHVAACRIIAEGAGSHFDPAVVETFIEVHREFEAITEQYMSDQQEELNSLPPERLAILSTVTQSSGFASV